MTRALYWFTRDLRLHDNPGLIQAASADLLLCVFVVDPRWFRPGPFQCRALGQHRWRFLWQSLMALDEALQSKGNRLHIAWGTPEQSIPALCRGYEIDELHGARLPGSYERRHWAEICEAVPQVKARQHENLTLFEQADLPFGLDQLPATFSAFRRQVEKARIEPKPPQPAPDALPPAPGLAQDARDQCPPVVDPAKGGGNAGFMGGETAAMAHWQRYLWDDQHIVHYKDTRNALDDWPSSAKLSPWLANGCLSARQVAADIQRFESGVKKNDSTYWLYFELLWREYFQWMAFAHNRALFQRDGVQRVRRNATFYGHRFQAWCQGNTEYPLVNAAMNQLRETGYISNRARQIVASCFVNELELDWRYGAAWFEQQLIDYDVASNYGNWQYLAGVGADPRGLRRFDLDKQTRQFDPDRAYIRKWRGDSEQAVGLHTVDAADWPIGLD
ncbi:DASH family cryptochrome [uncultured Marinobacter sp.]|uniref:DASH family cryptochrome n=1 Tax=uncultured Marinobacter sp. TaxID=187379 RepID=UPI0030DB1420